MANIFKLHSANIYLNGINYPHVASEITLPEVKHKLVAHEALSLQASFEIPLALEPMSLTVKGDFDPAFVAAMANHKDIHSLQIYSDLVEMDDDKGRLREMQVTASLRGLSKGSKPDSHKQGETVGWEFELSVLAYKLEVEGLPIYDIQVLNNRHTVLGTNLHSETNKVLAT